MNKQVIGEKELVGFENLLSLIDAGQLDINPYAKRYLTHLFLHKKYYCRIYAQLLNLAVEHCNIDKEAICIIDYGCGNGLMGLLAKYCGFGKVYLNDLNGDFLTAAKLLAAGMKIEIDDFIEGDIQEVKEYFTNSTPHVMVSTDVIEHIYDLDYFYTTVKEINPAMITVMSTACNPANYFKVKQFKKLQVKDELHGGTPDDHSLFGETVMEPFIEIRRKIIAGYCKGKLNTAEINTLATVTRGLRKDDIEKAVDKFIAHKVLLPVLSHPTNTCDPITGSWSERLLSFEQYKYIYSNTGFQVKFYDGFYNEYEDTLKSKLLFFVNRLVPLTGFSLSPFIILTGKSKF